MSVTLQNQLQTCNQYQFMIMDVPAGKAYPAQAVVRGNPGLLGAANSSVAANTNVVVNQAGDDSTSALLTVAYESGHSAVTSSPKWVGVGANGKATDMGAAFGTNAQTGQLYLTSRPAGSVGISQGAGTPGSTVKVALRPY